MGKEVNMPIKFTEQEFREKYVQPFEGVSYVHDERGYIIWRLGTGENVELLHIRSYEYRKGYATSLISSMLERLLDNPPYYSVFGFMLAENEAVINMYKKLGFNVQLTNGPYKHGKAVLMWQDFDVLVQKFLRD